MINCIYRDIDRSVYMKHIFDSIGKLARSGCTYKLRKSLYGSHKADRIRVVLVTPSSKNVVFSSLLYTKNYICLTKTIFSINFQITIDMDL